MLVRYQGNKGTGVSKLQLHPPNVPDLCWSAKTIFDTHSVINADWTRNKRRIIKKIRFSSSSDQSHDYFALEEWLLINYPPIFFLYLKDMSRWWTRVTHSGRASQVSTQASNVSPRFLFFFSFWASKFPLSRWVSPRFFSNSSFLNPPFSVFCAIQPNKSENSGEN